MSDELPDWVAQLDQARRAVRDVAALIHDYYLALVEQGFTEEQALALACAFQTQLQRGSAE